MRAVPRGSKPSPKSLTLADGNGDTELDRVRKHIDLTLKKEAANAAANAAAIAAAIVAGIAAPSLLKTKSFTFEVYKSEDVKSRLKELFHGKCAYCESLYGYQSPVDIEHYRPKGAVEGNDTHPGYWWLAAEWTNLLPSCIDCNRRRKQQTPNIVGSLSILYSEFQSGKKDSFPVEGKHVLPETSDFSSEKPLLLDPTRDNPETHLEYSYDADTSSGLVYPKKIIRASRTLPIVAEDAGDIIAQAKMEKISVRGAVSIQCYGLNRLGLVQQRARVVQQLRFLENILIDVSSVREEIENLNTGLRLSELHRAAKKLLNLEQRVIDQMRDYANPSAPYSAIAKAYMNDFIGRLGV